MVKYLNIAQLYEVISTISHIHKYDINVMNEVSKRVSKQLREFLITKEKRIITTYTHSGTYYEDARNISIVGADMSAKNLNFILEVVNKIYVVLSKTNIQASFLGRTRHTPNQIKLKHYIDELKKEFDYEMRYALYEYGGGYYSTVDLGKKFAATLNNPFLGHEMVGDVDINKITFLSEI